MATPPSTADLLRRRPPAQALRWVSDMIGTGSRVVSVRALPSSWLANHAITVADRHGRHYRLVLRRWARPGWDTDDPDYTAQREATILGLLADAAIPAPRLVAADPDGAACDTPALLLTRLPGHPPATTPRTGAAAGAPVRRQRCLPAGRSLVLARDS